MGQSPNLIDKKALSRAGIIGAILGMLGIGLFIGLWILLGNYGMAVFPRLVASICIPPALIALIMGAYILLLRPGSKS